MGRNKIPIKKLEPASQRRGTFKYKRSDGIKKKAKELSILSDTQLLLLMRDPNSQYHLTCHGENSTFDGVVQKFLSESQNNLDDSRRDSMEILQKSYKKDSHAINALSLMDHGMKAINKNHSSLEIDTDHIKQEISTIESQLGPLRKINEIDAIERFDELTAMECSIMELLSKNEQEMVHFVQQEKSGYPHQWDNLPATDYGDNYQVFNPTPFSYRRDPMASTSTALPMLPFSSMGGMEKLERVESIPTAMCNRDPMASTSTALPMLPFSSMGGMEKLERVESIPTAMYNRGRQLREDSSFQLSDSDHMMLCEWTGDDDGLFDLAAI